MEMEIGPTVGEAHCKTARTVGTRSRDAGEEAGYGAASTRAIAIIRPDEAPCKKRKASPTELREAEDAMGALVDDLTETCDRLTKSLRDTAFEQYEVENEDNLRDLRRAVRAIRLHHEAVKNRPPRVRSPNVMKPTMTDAATDTQLTPHWWAASGGRITDMPLAELGSHQDETDMTEIPARASRATKKVTGTYASVVGRCEPESSEESGEAEFTMVERRRRPKQKQAQTSTAPRENRPKPNKPPAVLIKVADGETFEDTLKTVRGAVDPKKLGVDVRRVAKTQDGHVLVELAGGPEAANGAAMLSRAVRDNAAGLADRVVQLGTACELEVVDIDPGAEIEDVRGAIETAMEALDGGCTEWMKTQILVTGLWQVKTGMKMATVKVPRAAANLTALRIGWTVAKVRPKKPEPLRCFRCHGFGHQSFKCSGPDLAGRCRKCGQEGHLEKNCVESNGCVACDRLGLSYQPHKTGSTSCPARRKCDADGDDGLSSTP